MPSIRPRASSVAPGIDYDLFQRLVRLEVERMPARFLRGLCGVFVERKAFRETGSLTGLYVLGHYIPHYHMAGGPAVVIYYGSFRRVFRGADDRKIRRELSRTVAHELLHHWEFQSGIDDLGDEDRAWLERWRRSTGRPAPSSFGRDWREALLFLLLLMAGITLTAWLVSP
ncbi:MAG TPA: metallopeptidase family protein [Candidatus Ozemobacteraceae bacterium]|nr:metallopeptidase family protein [Candidatus Ozemobacteraceae bacterium]